MTLEAFKPVNASICTKSFMSFTRTINAYPTMMFTIIAIVTTGTFWRNKNNIVNLTATKIKTNNTNISSLFKPCLQVQQHNCVEEKTCLLFYHLTLVSEHSYTASACVIVQSLSWFKSPVQLGYVWKENGTITFHGTLQVTLRTLWWLFQKRVVCSKLDTYLCIA